jgi:hypothetical protein
MVLDGRDVITEDTVVKPENIPALYEHACSVYEAMVALATRDELEGREVLVYEGHLTHVFKKLRLAVPYYTTIKNRLSAMGSIEQIKRGGGTATSRWVIWKEPTLDEWIRVTGGKPRSRGDRYLAMEQRQRDQIGYIRALQVRIEELEQAVARMQGVIEKVSSGHNV